MDCRTESMGIVKRSCRTGLTSAKTDFIALRATTHTARPSSSCTLYKLAVETVKRTSTSCRAPTLQPSIP